MATGKKYDFIIEQKKSEWVAKITRKTTSKKTVITKEWVAASALGSVVIDTGTPYWPLSGLV